MKQQIEQALKNTKRWLVVTDGIDWTEGFYPYTKRLAHLYFLLEEAGVEMWFVNPCSTNNITHQAQERQVGLDASHQKLTNAKNELGLNPDYQVLRRYNSDVFLPALPRREPTTG